MKDSIANVWLLGIIITFILLFSAYIAITVDYSQTFKLKNEVLNIIEKNKGMTNNTGTTGASSKVGGSKSITVDVGALQTINLYLAGNAYTAMGPCPDDGNVWYGVYDLKYTETNGFWEQVDTSKKKQYYYCFAKHKTGQANIKYNNKVSSSSTTSSSIYYKVRLFYNMEFPVLSDFFEVKVEGITNEIYRPIDDKFKLNGDIYS